MRRRWGAVAVLVCMALLGAACGGDDGDGGSGAEEATVDETGVLRVGVSLTNAGPLSFDPTTMGTGQYIHTLPVLRTLLTRNPDGTLKPDLAESAQVVDAQTVKVKLRPTLKFSDGTPVTSEAVKAAFERNVASNNSAGLQIPDMQRVSEFVVDSDTEFTLKLSQPFAAVVYGLLAGVEFAPYKVPAAGQTIDRTAIGAGPMTIESYTPEQRVVFTKNPHFWAADEVKLAGMEYVHVADAQAAENALRAGQIDYVTQVGYDIAKALETDGFGVAHQVLTGSHTMQLCMKPDTPLGKVEVRKAVNFAIDREAIATTVYGGDAEVAWDLWSAKSSWHNDDLDDIYEHDPDKAKQLLAQGGYPNGFEFTLTHGPSITPGEQRMFEIIQAQLGEVGIKMNILPNPGYATDFYLQNKYEATLTQSRPGPVDKVSRFYLSNSFANVCKFPFPEVDAKYAELAAVDPDSDEAVELWHEIQELIIDKHAIFPNIVFIPYSVAYDDDRVGEVVLYTNQLGSVSVDPVGTFIKG